MKKLLLLITVLFVFSCSSSDDSDENQPPPPDPVYRLVEVVQLDADSNIYETLLYDYDVNGLLIRSTEISNGTSYISNMLTSTEWINNGTTTITDFTYENGLIILATLNELNFTLTNEYSYNSLNQLISKKQFDQGVFLDNYITEDIRINCYAIDKFFVEVVYDGEQNVITEVRSFKYGRSLDKYSAKF